MAGEQVPQLLCSDRLMNVCHMYNSAGRVDVLRVNEGFLREAMVGVVCVITSQILALVRLARQLNELVLGSRNLQILAEQWTALQICSGVLCLLCSGQLNQSSCSFVVHNLHTLNIPIDPEQYEKQVTAGLFLIQFVDEQDRRAYVFRDGNRHEVRINMWVHMRVNVRVDVGVSVWVSVRVSMRVNVWINVMTHVRVHAHHPSHTSHRRRNQRPKTTHAHSNWRRNSEITALVVILLHYQILAVRKRDSQMTAALE